ncbi:MAG: hypothetical protein ISS49_15715, partial [Anaerolineae bacterium]|nr:hypothetical protein [Anaerolineae bacterium]
MNGKKNAPWVVKPLVPEEVYTDRTEFLEYFYEAALKAATRRTMSTVLLGQRRMGKTEIFKRVVNRLFWEQDHRDPQAVVPVYYSFRDEVVGRWEFAIDYVENFLRWYAAFRLRDPDIFSDKVISRDELPELIRANFEMTSVTKGMANSLPFLQEQKVTIPENTALTLPRWVSDHNDSTIVMFLDEFQNTRLPQQSFSVVGYMQEAVESPTCPHFVTGSAMSILAREIIGRGALFGRFRSKVIKSFSGYYGAELALKAARYHHAQVPEV